jgi:DNA-binding transcriptional regulator YiaG
MQQIPQELIEWDSHSIRSLRRGLRLTQEALAREIGTSVRTVARWESETGSTPSLTAQGALDKMLDRDE